MGEDRTDEVGAFVERFAAVLTDAGMPRLPARVFVALLASDEGRMTAAQLAERLQASAGGISGAVRYLSQVRMIHSEREPGSRRHVYVADGSWYESTVSGNPVLTRGETALRDGIAAVGDSPAGQRLQETLELIQFLRTESEAMLRRWDERRVARRSGQFEPSGAE